MAKATATMATRTTPTAMVQTPVMDQTMATGRTTVALVDIPTVPAMVTITVRVMAMPGSWTTTDMSTMNYDHHAGDFQLVVEREKPSAWTMGMLKLYFVLFFAFWGSAMNGYDGSLMAGIYTMKQFQSFVGYDQESFDMSVLTGFYPIGCLAAAPFGGPLSDTWGRKAGMGIGCVIVIIGTAMMALAPQNLGVTLLSTGRFFCGFGVTITTTAAPAYVIELSHPLYRGTIGGVYNTLWFIGNIIAYWVAYGTKNLMGDFSWRIPVWFQLVPATIILCGLAVMPESPRWLISVGMTEEAREILVKYHADGNEDSELVALEFNHMIETIRTDASDKRFYDYTEVFATRNARYRFLMVFLISFFGQFSGNNIFSYFQGTAYSATGLEDQSHLLQGILSVLQFMVALVGARSTDKFGRRKLIIWGTLALSVALGILAAASYVINPTAVGWEKVPQSQRDDVQTNKKWATYLVVASIYLFQLIYALCWTPMQALYPVECLATSTRAKGLGLSNLVTYSMVLVNAFAVPLGIKAIGWKFYIIYIIWNLLETVFLYFFMVETKGLTLEELDEVFSAPNPRKTSLRILKDIENSGYYEDY
ncbi:hypothetical protein HDV00_010080 [Rhizophlyctis rosea]|nr:hypothetical protein HDV00_010080 [Rhizophlyctis rosea]